MLEINQTAFRDFQSAMVTALHGCTDPQAEHTTIRTVDGITLKNAALALLSVIANDTVVARP